MNFEPQRQQFATFDATGANRTDKLRRVYLAQYTREVMLNPGTRQLRNNAVPLLLKGEIATVA